MISDFSRPVEITPELIQDRRSLICDFEKAMSSLQDSVGPETINQQVNHHFANGMYVREMFIPAGQVIVSKIHRDETVNTIAFGAISVISAESGFVTHEAPSVFVSTPMTKRIVMAHTDVIWVTVHKNPDNFRDIAKLEEITIAKDFEQKELNDTINKGGL
jgi:hypothetical protein